MFVLKIVAANISKQTSCGAREDNVAGRLALIRIADPYQSRGRLAHTFNQLISYTEVEHNMHLVDAAVYNLQALAERGRNTLKRCFSPVLDSSVPLLRKQEKWSRIQARDEEIV